MTSDLDDVQRVLRQAGALARPLARPELAATVRRWKVAFAAPGARLQYLWEAFTAERAAAVTRFKAHLGPYFAWARQDREVGA